MTATATDAPVALADVSDNWRTPRIVLDCVDEFCRLVGEEGIALDPCSGPGSQVGAAIELSLERGHDGLAVDWAGLKDGVAWINPPFSKPAPWIERAQKFGAVPGNHALVLINAQTSDGWWPEPWPPAVCFWRKRIKFATPQGTTHHTNTRPNALLYFGDAPELFEHVFKAKGKVVRS